MLTNRKKEVTGASPDMSFRSLLLVPCLFHWKENAKGDFKVSVWESALNEIPAGLCGFWITAKEKLIFKTNMKGTTF